MQDQLLTTDVQWKIYESELNSKEIFFGLVQGYELELDYFSLNELKAAKGPMNLPIERVFYYEPKSLKELIELHTEHKITRRSLRSGASNCRADLCLANRFKSPQILSSLLAFAVFLAQPRPTCLRRLVCGQFQQLLSRSLLETHSEFCSARRV